MRSLVRLTAILVVLSGWISPAAAQRVWYEYGVASATGGFDAVHNRTLINKFYLAVFGPDDVKVEAHNFVRHCIQDSAVAAVAAYQGTPSPEPGARIGAAWKGFHVHLEHCLSAREFAKEYIKKFEIGYIRRGYWEPGLNLRFTAENPSVKIYEQLHQAVKKDLPDPVNKLIVFYIQTQQPPTINIKINPDDAGKFLLQFPEPAQLRRYFDDGQKRAADAGKHLSAEVGRETREISHRLGSAGETLVVAPVRLVGKTAEEAAKKAPEIAGTMIPVKAGNGQVVWQTIPGPVPAEVSRHTTVKASEKCTQLGTWMIGGGCD